MKQQVSKRRSSKRKNKKGVFRKIKETPEDQRRAKVTAEPIATEPKQTARYPKPEPLRQSFQELLDQLISPSK